MGVQLLLEHREETLRTVLALLLLLSVGAPFAPSAHAHGERAQEPYLRTRTAHWYDVKWSVANLNVGDKLSVTGKFRLFGDWPNAVTRPETVFVSNATPGPVFARVESYLNDVPARQSFKDLEIGRDYEYKMILMGRIPGRYHVHPMIAVKGSGPLVGPGKWIEVGGNATDFVFPVTAISGEKIDDLATWGVWAALRWHLVWLVIAAAWILWWIRRPLLIPRLLALQQEREDLLVTNLDLKLGVLLLIVSVGLAFYGYNWAKDKYPRTVPLQAGTMKTPPLPRPSAPVSVSLKQARYDVPGRSMRVQISLANNGDKPVRIGEFLTASIRFVNPNLAAAKASVDPDYPAELIARNGLVLSDDQAIAPGATKDIKFEATDAAWEIERLTSFLTDVDSRFGGLLFLYDSEGKRHIVEVGGPIIPVFKNLKVATTP
jgi:methane/ammonia monooxygenase subunit B